MGSGHPVQSLVETVCGVGELTDDPELFEQLRKQVACDMLEGTKQRACHTLGGSDRVTVIMLVSSRISLEPAMVDVCYVLSLPADQQNPRVM